MDAALEQMGSLRQTGDIQLTALQNPGPRHRDVGKTAAAFRDGCLATVEGLYESSAELSYLGKGVGLSALVNHGKDGPLRDR